MNSPEFSDQFLRGTIESVLGARLSVRTVSGLQDIETGYVGPRGRRFEPGADVVIRADDRTPMEAQEPEVSEMLYEEQIEVTSVSGRSVKTRSGQYMLAPQVTIFTGGHTPNVEISSTELNLSAAKHTVLATRNRVTGERCIVAIA